ncbi:MAG: DevR family CRISPR-associated autoregulator [Nitrososphaerales archaeon]
MYVGLAIKLVLNMHDLNNERAEEIRRVPIIYARKDGSWQVFEEAVAISGVMLKHWHFVYCVDLGLREGINFCDYCRRFEAIRVPSKTAGTEFELISRCMGEDVHGFLRPEPTLRRESLVRFSWGLPLLNEQIAETFGMPTTFRVLQHSRNVREIPEEAPEEVRQAQMPYPRSYGDGVYGYVASLDLQHVGYSFTEEKNLDSTQKEKRQRVAIQAFIPMLTGAMGGSMARALPVADVLEVLLVSSSKPIPAPVHPIYPDYYESSVALYKGVSKTMDCDVNVFVWSKESVVKEQTDEKFKLRKVEGPAHAFAEILKTIKSPG